MTEDVEKDFKNQKQEKREELYEEIDFKVGFMKDLQFELSEIVVRDYEKIHAWVTEKRRVLAERYPGILDNLQHIIRLRDRAFEKENEVKDFFADNIETQSEEDKGVIRGIFEAVEELRAEADRLRTENPHFYFTEQVISFFDNLCRKKKDTLNLKRKWDTNKADFFDNLERRDLGRDKFGAKLRQMYEDNPKNVHVEADGIHLIVWVNDPNLILGTTFGFRAGGSSLICVKERRDEKEESATLHHEKNHNYFSGLDVNKIAYARHLKEEYSRYKRLKELIPDVESDELVSMVENALENLQGEFLADIERFIEDEPSTFLHYIKEVSRLLNRIIGNETDSDLKASLIEARGVFKKKAEMAEKDLRNLLSIAKKTGKTEDLKMLIIIYGFDTRKIGRYMRHVIGEDEFDRLHDELSA